MTTGRFDRDTFPELVVGPWAWDTEGGLALRHQLGPFAFEEIIELPAAGGALPPRVVDLLAAVAGVSYFKVSAPRRVRLDGPALTPAGLDLVRAAYDHGLREFAVRNDFDVPLTTEVVAPAAVPEPPAAGLDPGAIVLPMGGGRDSGLVATALAHRRPALLTIGENRWVDGLGVSLGLPVAHATRRLPPLLGELNAGPARNGHVPVTAITTLVTAVHAARQGAGAVVLANERSASAPSLVLDGHEVNHQWSKSRMAERLVARALAEAGGPTSYSAVRPWSELAIARGVARRPELLAGVMSCNRAYLRDPARRSPGWCGECAKCRFVYLTLAPFAPPEVLVRVFGRDLLDDGGAASVTGFAELLSTSGRPWDCVGEEREARAALALLSVDPRWRAHEVVAALAAGRPDEAELADLLAPAPDHDVPPDVYDDVARLLS